MLRRLEEAGAAPSCCPRLFEEQIDHEEVAAPLGARGRPNELRRGPRLLPRVEDYNTGPDDYLRHVAAAKAALEIPVIGSLNGTSPGGWVRYARLIQEAGADALELNIYSVEADPDDDGRPGRDEDPRPGPRGASGGVDPAGGQDRALLQLARAHGHAARRAGADGLVLFNRFLQPDIDLETLTVVNRMLRSRRATSCACRCGGSRSCTAASPVSLAATSGVHDAEDVIKALLAGADVAMTASALLKHGPEKLSEMLADVERGSRRRSSSRSSS